jgi:hypothetical protein
MESQPESILVHGTIIGHQKSKLYMLVIPYSFHSWTTGADGIRTRSPLEDRYHWNQLPTEQKQADDVRIGQLPEEENMPVETRSMWDDFLTRTGYSPVPPARAIEKSF